MHLFWDLYDHTVNTKKNLSWWRRPTTQGSKHRHKEKYLRSLGDVEDVEFDLTEQETLI